MSNELKISDYLRKGRQNGTRNAELESLTGLTRRETRKAIYDEMVDGKEFVINLQDGNGYFIPDLDTEEGIEDAKKYISQERARAFTNLKKIRRLEGAVAFVTGENFWKSARLKAGYTRLEVMQLTHIDSATLSKIENKRIEPTVEQETRLRRIYF